MPRINTAYYHQFIIIIIIGQMTSIVKHRKTGPWLNSLLFTPSLSLLVFIMSCQNTWPFVVVSSSKWPTLRWTGSRHISISCAFGVTPFRCETVWPRRHRKHNFHYRCCEWSLTLKFMNNISPKTKYRITLRSLIRLDTIPACETS